MTDMQLDIPTNIAQYPAWQAFLKKTQPRTLVVWGTGDAIFTPAGAAAFKTLIPSAEVHRYKTGHFALEEDSDDIARQIIRFFPARSAER